MTTPSVPRPSPADSCDRPGALSLPCRLSSVLAVAALLVALVPPATAAPHAPVAPAPARSPSSAGQDVEIRTVPVTDGIYMLVGQGGNIGVSVGDDGVILIDDQFAPLTEQIRAAIAEITDAPILFVINTHWHDDHTNGNENFGEAGALIVAHENVRERMSTEQFIEFLDSRVPASPEAALPVVTFTDAMTLHFNGEAIRVVHVDPAHTDGDSFVWFERSNAVHMGDLFFAGRYPFIDLSSGGSLDGVIAAADRVLGLATPETRIIPGHGPLSDFEGLVEYRDVLTAARARILEQVRAGRTLEEVLASEPTSEWDAEWGSGFISGEAFVRLAYQSLAAR